MAAIIKSNKPYALKIEEMQTLLNQKELNAAETALLLGRSESWEASYLYSVMGSIAVIRIEGPIFRYNCFEMWWSGGVCCEDIAALLDKAANDISVKKVLLYINSPGGEVDGTPELADMIYKYPKPIYSYASSLMASAGYWIGAACDMIFAQEAASIGSVGVYGCIYDISKMLENAGVQELIFRSSQSPKKNPDPKTEEGKSQIQIHIDQLAEIFIDKLAIYRRTTAEKVISDFGQGNTFLANQSLDAGMIDAVADFEETLQFLEKDEDMKLSAFFRGRAEDATPDDAAPGETPPDDATENQDPETPVDNEAGEDTPDEEMKEKGETLNSLSAKYPSLIKLAIAKGAKSENDRCKSIDDISAKNPGYSKLCYDSKYSSLKSKGEFAEALLSAKAGKREETSKQFAEDKEAVPELNNTAQDKGQMKSKEENFQKLAREAAKDLVTPKGRK